MNRHARRAEAAAGRHHHSPHGIFYQGKSADFTRAIVAAEQAGQPGVAELFRAVAGGVVSLVSVERRDTVLAASDLTSTRRPTVALVGDDDFSATGPSGWRAAKVVAGWAKAAVIHAAGQTASSYREAVRSAIITGAAALIETDAEHAMDWVSLFQGKEVLLVWPRDGANPVRPNRGELH